MLTSSRSMPLNQLMPLEREVLLDLSIILGKFMLNIAIYLYGMYTRGRERKYDSKHTYLLFVRCCRQLFFCKLAASQTVRQGSGMCWVK